MSPKMLKFLTIFAAVLLVFSASLSAQTVTGNPPFSTIGGGPFDQINLGNLNNHFCIPIVNKTGRGVPFTYSLCYDSSVWASPTGAVGTAWSRAANWGWTVQNAAPQSTTPLTGSLQYSSYQDAPCYGYNWNGTWYGEVGVVTYYNSFTYYDRLGVPHSIDYSAQVDQYWGDGNSYDWCSVEDNNIYTNGNGSTSDGSGYSMIFASGTDPAYNNFGMMDASGAVFSPPINSVTGPGSYTDRNGNQISSDGSGHFTDTLGTTALTISGTNPISFTYTGPSGPASYKLKYSSYTVKTAFGCSGVTEYTGTSQGLVSEIDLPDQATNTSDKYLFTYETTPGDTHSPPWTTGRIASVKLPTGGTINYYYPGDSGYSGTIGASNNGIVCSDGTTAGMERTTPDTGSGSHWDYARTIGTSPNPNVTLITDPSGNQTNMQFQGIYLVEEQDYSGLTTGTLLKTILNCYNGDTNAPNCVSDTIYPGISEVYTSSQWGSSGLTSSVATTYTDAGQFLSRTYFSTTGAIYQNTLVNYATLGNGILDQPSSVTISDGHGNVAAQTTYSYDEYGVQSTSGTPQHTSISGSRGNVTTVNSYVNSTTAL